MKRPREVYETYSTDLSAALRAVGCDLIQADPIRRIFDEKNPPNTKVSHGLGRGGRVQYRHKTTSSEFSAPATELAQAWAEPEKVYDGEEWIPIPKENQFDNMLNALRAKLAGTEAGRDLEKIAAEYPKEIMRYLKGQAVHRKENIQTIADREDIVELVKIKKADGHFVIHHINLPADKVQALLEA